MDLKGLYVVRETFKIGTRLFKAGTLLSEEDLHGIRLWKIRLNEKKVVPVPENKKDYLKLKDFFQLRYNFDLSERLRERASKGSESAEPKTKVEDKPTPGTPKTSEKPKPLSKSQAKPNPTKK
jgi:outer membrane biosynthesis protein TonB